MALTPCLVVGDEKPLDVESNGFFFIINFNLFQI